MKKYLFFLLLMAFPACIWAQEKSFYFLPEVTVFENINAWDFTHEGNYYPGMKAPATTGVSLGIGCRKNNKNGFYFSWALGLTLNPQKITLTDFSNTFPQQRTERFTNTDFWLRLMLGVNAVKLENGYFDIAAGVKFIYGLKGKKLPGTAHFKPYLDPVSGEEFNYLVAYDRLNWGDSRAMDDFIWSPAMLCFSGQIAYNFRLKNKKLLRIALDFSSNFGSNENTQSKNAGFETLFNQQREQVGKTTFNDQYTHLGINVSIAL